jgi:hypothetical protein
MKKQCNTQLALTLLVLVAFVLLLVDNIRTSPLTFISAKEYERPLPVISNDPDGDMPYTWQTDNWDINLNPKWLADHFHIPVYAS